MELDPASRRVEILEHRLACRVLAAESQRSRSLVAEAREMGWMSGGRRRAFPESGDEGGQLPRASESFGFSWRSSARILGKLCLSMCLIFELARIRPRDSFES